MAITITEGAATRIREAAARDGRPEAFLRIAVSGGGCQGFRYDMSIETEAMEGDAASSLGGATVMIDGSSASFLKGSTLDWVSEPSGESFTISNPRASSSCGCGESFS